MGPNSVCRVNLSLYGGLKVYPGIEPGECPNRSGYFSRRWRGAMISPGSCKAWHIQRAVQLPRKKSGPLFNRNGLIHRFQLKTLVRPAGNTSLERPRYRRLRLLAPKGKSRDRVPRGEFCTWVCLIEEPTDRGVPVVSLEHPPNKGVLVAFCFRLFCFLNWGTAKNKAVCQYTIPWIQCHVR